MLSAHIAKPHWEGNVMYRFVLLFISSIDFSIIITILTTQPQINLVLKQHLIDVTCSSFTYLSDFPLRY